MASKPLAVVTDGPDSTLAERRERVVARGRSLAVSVDALGREIRRVTDWRTQVVRHPFWALGAAAGVGLLAVGVVSRRRRLEPGILGAAAEIQGLAAGLETPSRTARKSGGAGNLIRGVLGVLVARVLRPGPPKPSSLA